MCVGVGENFCYSHVGIIMRKKKTFNPVFVIPVKFGIQWALPYFWMPASAGYHDEVEGRVPLLTNLLLTIVSAINVSQQYWRGQSDCEVVFLLELGCPWRRGD